MLVKPKAYGASELDGPLRAIETPTKSHLTERGLVKFTGQISDSNETNMNSSTPKAFYCLILPYFPKT